MKSLSTFFSESQNVLNTIDRNYGKKHPGVNVDASYDKKTNSIRVNQLFVPPASQGKGIGTRVMRGLGKYADKNNMKVSLNQDPDKGKKAKLQKFYRGHGFVPNRGKNKDFSTKDSYIRKPQIKEDFKDLTPAKEKRVMDRMGELTRDVQVLGAKAKEMRGKPLAKYRPKLKKNHAEIVKTAKKKANLVRNASDAVIRTSTSRSAAIQHKINKLKEDLVVIRKKD